MSISECYFVKSDGVLIHADSPIGMAFGRVQPGALPDVKGREPCLPPCPPPPPQNLQLHTSSRLTENHSSVSWAMLAAASNKPSPSPSPALGKQTRLGVRRTEEAGDRVPWHFYQESRSCSQGSVTIDKAQWFHPLLLSLQRGSLCRVAWPFPCRVWATEWICLPVCLRMLGGDRRKGT